MNGGYTNPLWDDSFRWISGNMIWNDRQYIFEMLRAPYPVRLGIFKGTILQLHLYDDLGQKIAEYNHKWVIGPRNGTEAYRIVGKILKEYNYEKKGRKTA